MVCINQQILLLFLFYYEDTYCKNHGKNESILLFLASLALSFIVSHAEDSLSMYSRASLHMYMCV